jgi:hypothetical protein
MLKICLILFVLLASISCSMTEKLSRSYNGKGVEVLYKEMGNPNKIIENDNGNKTYIYIKETFVRQTEISTGRFNLDKRMSPSFIKVELFHFEVNKDGIIQHSEYEKQIE